jgi:hypothetical protein
MEMYSLFCFLPLSPFFFLELDGAHRVVLGVLNICLPCWCLASLVRSFPAAALLVPPLRSSVPLALPYHPVPVPLHISLPVF